MKVRPVEAELFHAGRRMYLQTAVTTLMVSSRNFAKERNE